MPTYRSDRSGTPFFDARTMRARLRSRRDRGEWVLLSGVSGGQAGDVACDPDMPILPLVSAAAGAGRRYAKLGALTVRAERHTA